MAKLTKQEARNHDAALELLKKEVLSSSDKEFVFNNYHPGATSMNGAAGAFFTPLSMAFEVAHEAGGDSEDKRTFIDLCAGIGVLAYALVNRYPKSARIVCVDINREYVEIGKRLVPEAEWYCLDVMDIDSIKALGSFRTAISNPPFGKVRTFKDKAAPRYTGAEAEYKVIDVAGLVADNGVFIIPQQSSGFRYSGAQCFEHVKSSKYERFVKATGIELEAGMGFDTTCEGMYLWTNEDGQIVDCNWMGVNPRVEFACCDFPEIEEANDEPVTQDERVSEDQLDLFSSSMVA